MLALLLLGFFGVLMPISLVVVLVALMKAEKKMKKKGMVNNG